MCRHITPFIMFFCLAIVTVSCARGNEQQIARADTTASKGHQAATRDSLSSVSRSPRGAMLRSLFVPGWGQVYNGKWLKAAIIAGAEIGLITNAVVQNQLAVNSTNAYDREFYANNRGLSLWWLAGVILYSMADAYVDAQLYNFDESPDLSFHASQGTGQHTSNQQAITVTLSYHF